MAVIITDNRTRPTQADTTTGWTSSSGVAVFTSAPTPVEATGCLGVQVSNSTEDSYFSQTAANLTDTLVYCWLLPGGVLETVVGGGVQIYLGDGTNNRGYHIGGSNGAGFRHDAGPVVWQCFVVDTGNLPANTSQFGGGAPNFGAITRVGNVFTTLAKSVGNQENCFIDIIAYGNGGLTITGGGTGTEGKFLEIATADRSEANLTAYGICRELGSGLFGLQGPLTFGSTGTGSVDFEDTGLTVVFEDRNIGTNKYGITIAGGTGNTTVIFGNRDGVGLGSQGVNFVCPTGVGAFWNASDTDINLLGLYGGSLAGFNNGVTFTSSATTGPNHEIFSTAFRQCGLITVGTTEFRNNSITGSVATSAVLLETTSIVSDLVFTSAGTGHAITIETPGTYDFTDFTYEGYAATDGSTGNESFYNNSGGAVTINVSGGDSPTVRNGAGASTVVNNNISITVTNLKDNTEVRVFLTSTLDNAPPYTAPTEVAGVEIATDGTAGARSFTFSVAAGTGLTIRTFNERWIAADIAIVPTSSQEVQIAQQRDRVFTNPS